MLGLQQKRKVYSMKKIIIFCNSLVGLLSFRKELIKELVKNKYKVCVVAPEHDYSKDLKKLKCDYTPIDMDLRGTNPIKDLKLIKDFKKIMRKQKPDLVLTYTIKPNVYGGYVCGKMGIPYICNVTGLGTSVEKPGALQMITFKLYKTGLKNARCVFFQNKDNQIFMKQNELVSGKCELIPGSGVNLNYHKLLDYPQDNVIRFCYISRIIFEKGIEDYLAVAKYIKERYPNTEFHILGPCDDEKYKSIIEELEEAGTIIYHGSVKDVREFQKLSNCTIHPTFYPEGMSNVLLESCAAGRPIITTNRPGCREIVDDGVNGYMVECHDVEGLKNKVEKFINLPNKEKKMMGLNGRKKVEKQFDRRIVVDAYLQEIGGILL